MDAVVTVPLPPLAQNDGDEQLNTDVTVTVTNTADSELTHTSRSANTAAAGETTPVAHGTAEVGGTTGNPDDSDDEEVSVDANITLGEGSAGVDPDGPAWFGAELAAAARPFPSEKPTSRTYTTHNDEEFDEGFDSDGELPFDYDYDNDDPATYKEPILPTGVATTEIEPPQAPAAGVPQNISATTMLGMKNEDLKRELRRRGLTVAGNKMSLQKRLRENLNLPVCPSVGDVAGGGGGKSRDASMGGLPFSAHWELLDPNPIPIPEPENEDTTLRPPSERDAPINPKYGYDETFDRRPFTGTNAKLPLKSNSLKKRGKKGSLSSAADRRAGARVIPGARVDGGPNKDHLKKYGLTERSHPMDWLNSILPMTPRDNKETITEIDVKGDGRTLFSVSNWTHYMNAKAMLVGAGQQGHIYEGRWKNFEVDDTQKIMGAMIIDGLAPSPRLVQKMKSQRQDRTQGNDFIASAMGPNAELKYKLFRQFHGCQDPLTSPPERAKCPNYKCDEFFCWLRYIWKKAWVLGRNFSVDKQTCSMQGQSMYKTRCGKFKRIGDGLQTDCIADDGYTWDFYFRNEPVDHAWIHQGLSPMHARLMHMFSQLEEQGHECNMDNLFNSVKFARAAFSLPQKVKVQGVIRKSGRGVPPVVLQEPAKGKAAEGAARGTTKVAVLRGDPKSQDLIVASCYDQKPFYMISNAASHVTWDKITKKMYSHVQKKKVPYSFLRWSLSNNYNYEMNDNDVADQYRLVYRLMRFQRNQKWWWCEWLWGIEVSMVNAYWLMASYHKYRGLECPMTHYEFQEKIGYALLDPKKEWPNRTTSALGQRKRPFTPSPPRRANRPRVNEKTMDPKGSLCCRLNKALAHTPRVIASKSLPACQLHRQANMQVNKDTNHPKGGRRHVYECRDCGVALCIPCWEAYHRIECFEKSDYVTILST